MAERPFWPDGDEPADWETTSANRLIQAALLLPDPAPQAEQQSRERALAQFEDMSPVPRSLRESAEPAAWTERIGRVVRRWLGK